VPSISEFKCNKCNFALNEGSGGYCYVINDNGKRMPCRHPMEFYDLENVLGSIYTIEELNERTGYISECICLDCLCQFRADVGEITWNIFAMKVKHSGIPLKQRDGRKCPRCGSKNVKAETEMVDEPCPKCKVGVIEETVIGWS